MTSANDIMKVSDIQREIDVLVNDLTIGPGGLYLLQSPTCYKMRDREQQQFRREMEQLEREVRPRPQTAAPRKPPSETNFSSYAAGVVGDASSQAGPRTSPRTRPGTGNKDFSEEHKSKYGDKRSGVMTPREPSVPAWHFPSDLKCFGLSEKN
ncbi:hypothetical protein PpBr36_03643 [Pyricularia pennisetigena]|uniref:hypothetical protein n=1 Tax=Pyricularia pennisetigena TaxID=1578925 RepID=UPI001151723B|nr:hypothetical protein PpBr36_03643 [Pyricularia pennisetigena]TLS31484.1 hypothetical protein PpBr36_03643 [Pyricularia pennisetigena]